MIYIYSRYAPLKVGSTRVGLGAPHSTRSTSATACASVKGAEEGQGARVRQGGGSADVCDKACRGPMKAM